MKNQIKELRVKIDGLAQLTKELKPIITIMIDVNSEEIEKAYDSLIFAKAWLGRVLFELGDNNPYAKSDGTRKTVEDIEPTADVSKGKSFEEKVPGAENFEMKYTSLGSYLKLSGKSEDEGYDYTNRNHIEKVDWLRQEIEGVVNEIKHLDGGMTNHAHQRPSREFNISRTNAYTYACEARMWLGFELQRIKETVDEKTRD